jgi:hypothetical protein
MHEKKHSTGKICGIIFFVLTSIILLFCICFSIYFSGQQKVVDKFYSAIERQDSKMLSECLSGTIVKDDCSEIITQQYNTLSQEYSEDFNVLSNFVKRTKNSDGGYDYYVDVTFYNDDMYKTYKDVLFHLILEKGRWKISYYSVN